MAGSVNKVILVGNLGKDPEVRHAQNGSKIVTFSLATSENWKDPVTGELKNRTEWHRVVIFNEKLGDIVERYLKKGAKIYLEGQLQTRKWTDNNGQEKYTTEVVLSRYRGDITMLDGRAASTEDNTFLEGGQTSGNFISSGESSAAKPFDNFDDEIPF